MACVEKRRMGEGEKDLHSDIEQRSKRPVGISATSSQQQPPFEKTHYRFFFLTGGDSAICPLPIFVKSYNQGTWKQSQDVIHRKKNQSETKILGSSFFDRFDANVAITNPFYFTTFLMWCLKVLQTDKIENRYHGMWSIQVWHPFDIFLLPAHPDPFLKVVFWMVIHFNH